MASYRPGISRDKYHLMEIYYFKLVQYTISLEFRDLSTEDHAKIYGEMYYLEVALEIMRNIFSVKGTEEKPVVAWKKESEEDEHKIIFRFSCIKVAAGSLGCNQSKISAVCKGKIKTTGGYIFMYENEYDKLYLDGTDVENVDIASTNT